MSGDVTQEAARERRLLSCHIETNLAVIAKITPEQVAALLRLFQDSDATKVRVSWSFDLPTGWLYWIVDVGGLLVGWHGGISPEGEVHT